MQLAVPRLLSVGDNKFYDVDPVCEPGSDFIENAFEGFILIQEFKGDTLQNWLGMATTTM